MSKGPPKKQPRLDEAPAAEARLTASASVGSDASQRQIVHADETEQKAAAGATAAWVESTTMPFPTGLPMENEYNEREFYVRACYPKYYKIILRLLKNRKTRVVTVTGTPGIGKFIFYAYFLTRFSFEAKEATVITASFSRKSVWEKVAVWKGGEMLDSAGVRFANSSDMNAVVKKAETGAANKLLYLIDGPPQVHPQDVQSVVFASPNAEWFKYIMKNSTRPMVLMPLWTVEELETAAIQLELTVDALQDDDGDDSVIADDIFREEKSERGGTLLGEEEKAGVSDEDVPVAPMVADLVEQRFQIFGGVARACLSTSEQFVKDEQGSIADLIKSFKDVAQLRALLDHENDHEMMYHRICYLVPKEGNVREYTIAEPTPFVKQLLIECLRDLTKSERKVIVDVLKKNPAAASSRSLKSVSD